MKTKLVLILLLISCSLYSQNVENKFSMDFSSDISSIDYSDNSNEVRTITYGCDFKYRILKHTDVILGEAYEIRYSFEKPANTYWGVNAGIGYYIPVKTYSGESLINIYLIGTKLHTSDILSFNNYFINTGVKLVFNKFLFLKFGGRYTFDKYSDFSLNYNNSSINFQFGFGLTFNFEDLLNFHTKKRV